MINNRTVKILGIDFFNGEVNDVVKSLKGGGLLVVPSAPGLITIQKDNYYYQSLLDADVVIPDSGYMALLWNISHNNKIKRISGLKFLNAFFNDEEIKKADNICLVNPNLKEAEVNLNYLKYIGFSLNNYTSYIAPQYSKNKKIADNDLLNLIIKNKPKYIVINLGGGIQEKLGSFLKRNLDYKPAIICTGAAIAFLTGEQVSIPMWADKLFLGWLFRCLKKPSIYIPRYFNALKLILLMWSRNNSSTVL